jgi:hypothetical protein
MRFTLLTNAFSKKLENHIHALSIYFMHYNFVRIRHSGSRPLCRLASLTRYGRLKIWCESWLNGKRLAMNYDDQWRDLHNRIRLFWFVFLGYGPAVLLITFALGRIFRGLDDRAFPWIAGVWGIAYLAAGIYRTAFRCPRCRGWFFGGFFTNPYRQKCGHCGLQRWT